MIMLSLMKLVTNVQVGHELVPDNQFHNLAWDGSQADGVAVPRYLFITLLEDWSDVGSHQGDTLNPWTP